MLMQPDLVYYDSLQDLFDLPETFVMHFLIHFFFVAAKTSSTKNERVNEKEVRHKKITNKTEVECKLSNIWSIACVSNLELHWIIYISKEKKRIHGKKYSAKQETQIAMKNLDKKKIHRKKILSTKREKKIEIWIINSTCCMNSLLDFNQKPFLHEN